MFIGHFAVALAAKRLAEHVSLGWLFAACQLPDLTWPVLPLAGAERARIAPGDTAFTPLEFVRYPWSHSLVMVVIQGVALAAAWAWWADAHRMPDGEMARAAAALNRTR